MQKYCRVDDLLEEHEDVEGGAEVGFVCGLSQLIAYC